MGNGTTFSTRHKQEKTFAAHWGGSMKDKQSTRSLNLGLAAIACILLGVHVMAQVETGRFVGHISDTQGAAIVHASVSAKNVETNITQGVFTDSDGNYVITPVAAGVYTLMAKAEGFSSVTMTRVEVQVGQSVREDL